MVDPYVPPPKVGLSGSSLKSPAVEAERKPEDGYTGEEIINQYSYDQRLETLNHAPELTASRKPILGFVIAFQGQRPQWPPMLLCRSNLNTLPRPDSLPSEPIPVFEEIAKRCTSEDRKPRFVYAGAHKITGIQPLKPDSSGLFKTLKSKFPEAPKSQKAKVVWDKSLKTEWAIVKMEKVEGDEAQRNPMVPLKEMREKPVNEMGKESRQQDSGPAKESEKPSAEDESEDILKSEDP